MGGIELSGYAHWPRTRPRSAALGIAQEPGVYHAAQHRVHVTAMAVDQSASFGAQLRRHRVRAGLTQQALAERAGLSLGGLSDRRDRWRNPRWARASVCEAFERFVATRHGSPGDAAAWAAGPAMPWEAAVDDALSTWEPARDIAASSARCAGSLSEGEGPLHSPCAPGSPESHLERGSHGPVGPFPDHRADCNFRSMTRDCNWADDRATSDA
jgi:hypothetical protein